MNLSRISIQRPVSTSMINLALVLFGFICLQQLPVRELPDIDPPIVSVTTVYPGANAEVVETEVTERLEEAINSIEGIREISSESREQVSVITVEFFLNRPIEESAQDVRDRISRVRGKLPDEVDEPIVTKQDADADAIIWISLRSDEFTPVQLTDIAEKQIKPRLQTVPGVSSLMMGGEKRYAVRLWLDASKMSAHRVTVSDVRDALRHQNVKLPSGRIENLDREMTIQTRGELQDIDEFNNLVIRTEGSRTIRLKDIGKAEDGVEDLRVIARINQQPCIFMGVVKQSKANTVSVAKGIRREIDRIQGTLPKGMILDPSYDSSIYIENSIKEVWITLGIAFALVILVIYLFLKDLRSTLIPALAIPVSIVSTFIILYLLDYSINILTLLALVLSIGIVVDDAIVVLENIFRHIEAGLAPLEAAHKAMQEIGFAILAITISLVAVFLPLAFQKTTTGRLFVEFAITIAGSVILSAFVALTLSPMMAAYLLKPRKKTKHPFIIRWFDRWIQSLSRRYLLALNWSLNHRLVVTGIGLLCFAVAAFTYTQIEHEYIPEEDKNSLLCFVITPEGSTSEYTDRMLRKMETILAEYDEILSYGAMVAPAFSGPGQASFGIIFVKLKDKRIREKSVQQLLNGPNGIRARFFNEVEGAIAIPSIPKALGNNFQSSPFELIIQGQDLDSLHQVATDLVAKFSQSGFLMNTRSSFEITKPEMRLSIDRNRAATMGVSIQDLSQTLQVLFGGLDLSSITSDGKEYEVIAQLNRESRLRPEDLDKLYVRNSRDELIQINSIVSQTTGVAPNSIHHFNRLRSAKISASPAGIPIGATIEKTEDLLAKELPEGFLYDWDGETREMLDASSTFWWYIVMALIFVYMVLASQFESLIHPLTVILAVPLAAFGAFGALWFLSRLNDWGITDPIPGMTFNLFSQIGMVLLIGLVTKNSILLVEFANQGRARGLNAREAMLKAGAVRFRPILMTAISTIAGILPIAIGFGVGAESRRPMGVVVVGGMLTSTILTLFVIPCIYSSFDELSLRLKSLKVKGCFSPTHTGTLVHF